MTSDTISTNSGAAMDVRVARPGRRRRQWIIRGGIAAVVVGGAGALYVASPGASALVVDASTVRTGMVERAAFRDFVPLRAEVAPLRTVVISAITGGQVADVIASDGDTVTAQTPLARLSNPALELEVASKSADIAGQLSAISGQQLAVQRSQLDGDRDVADATNALLKAQTELQKKQVLLARGIVNQAAVQPLIDEVRYQQSRVAALTGGRSAESSTLGDQSRRIAETQRQLRESLAMVRRSVEALTVRAPVAGRLTAFTLQPGQTLKPGDPIGQIDSDGDWKLIADVDQFYLARTRTGLAAIADIDGKSYRVHVTKLLPQVKDGRFRIELGFDGPPPALNRGQTMDVRLVLGADSPAVIAPAGGWLDANGTTAFVVDPAGGRAVRRAITTGRRNPDQVEVTAGLAPGDRIVTTAIGPYAAYSNLILR